MEEKIGVIGLGYVGLPLAVELSKHYEILGFDVNEKRIEELKTGEDRAKEVSKDALLNSKIKYTSNKDELKQVNFFIIAVPTPVTKNKVPDLTAIKSVANLIGETISKGSVVVLESTVYPGTTEDILGKTIEKVSGLRSGEDFFLGYSPERISPGDKEKTIEKIVKVVSGQDRKTLDRIKNVYSKICKAGLFEASSIKVAESAKVVENVQRDVNIALMNEFSIIFKKLNIKTKEVLDACNTKWNFLNFHPGLVGGHCIGVDPYYLTFKAEEFGYPPEIILTSRRLNDHMPKVVVDLLVRKLNQTGKSVSSSKILVLGLAFKDNVKDCRNSKAKDIIRILRQYGAQVFAVDPLLNEEKELVKEEFEVELEDLSNIKDVDAIILAAAHKEFKEVKLEELREKTKENPVLLDLRHFFNEEEAKKLGFSVETL